MQLNLDNLTPGMRLRVLRTVSGLKVWELASDAGVPQGRISEIENGRRGVRPEERIRLIAALKVRLPGGCIDEAL